MKYLAAYALLALSGKKDISTSFFTQTPMISKPFSAVFNLMHQMMTSTKSSLHLRANLSIS